MHCWIRNLWGILDQVSHMKCVLQVIERVSMVDGIYKDIYGWDLEYMKLLWEKVGDKHLLS